MADDDDFVRITLRIPLELHRQLNDAAAKKRSMNAEIIGRLEASFNSDFDDMATRLALTEADLKVTREQELRAKADLIQTERRLKRIEASRPPHPEEMTEFIHRLENIVDVLKPIVGAGAPHIEKK